MTRETNLSGKMIVGGFTINKDICRGLAVFTVFEVQRRQIDWKPCPQRVCLWNFYNSEGYNWISGFEGEAFSDYDKDYDKDYER